MYYPIYALTGKVPTMVLSSFMLGFTAVCAMFWALKTLYAFSKIKANLLLWEVGMCGAILSTVVHTHVLTATHYNLPYQSMILWLSLAVGAVCSLAQATSRKKQLGYALLLGVAVVMVVMSRPLSLLFLLTLAAPIFFYKLWQMAKAQERWALPFTACAVPVAIGAVIVMVYNYLRFDTIFEFGQNYQLTGWDITANSPELSWAQFKNVLYYFFFEPLTYSKDFPFVLLSNTLYQDHGNIIYVVQRFSVFSLPLFWILFTAWFWFTQQQQDNTETEATAIAVPVVQKDAASGSSTQESSTQKSTPSQVMTPSALTQGMTVGVAADMTKAGLTLRRLKQIIFGCTIVASVLIAYLEYFNAGVSLRYTSDLTLPLAFVVLWLLMEHITYEPTRRGQILYGVVLFFAVKTIVIELLLACNDFNGELCFIMYPDALVYLRRLLDPLVF